MGGAENLKGIDFQVSYCVLRVLDLLKHNTRFDRIEFEGLDHEGQDLSIIYDENAAEIIQVKTRGEGYLWSPSSIRPVIEKFSKNSGQNVRYTFFTNGSLSNEMIKLRDIIEKKTLLPNSSIPEKLVSPGSDINLLGITLKNTSILSQQYVSNETGDPAAIIRAHCVNVLKSAPFSPLIDPTAIYDAFWNLAFKLSKENGSLSYSELHAESENLRLLSKDNRLPLLSDVIIRKDEFKRLESTLDNYDISYFYGLSGAGKSTSIAYILSNTRPDDVFWVTITPMHGEKEIRAALANSLEGRGMAAAAAPLRRADEDAGDAINYALCNSNTIIVFDAIEKSSPSLTYLFLKITPRKNSPFRKSKIVFIGQKVEEWHSELALMTQSMHTQEIRGLEFSEFLQFIYSKDKIQSEVELLNFFNNTGGLPLAASLLRDALETNLDGGEEEEIFSASKEKIHSMLFNKIISKLNEKEQEIVKFCSVFEDKFGSEELNLILKEPITYTSLLLQLVPKSVLIRFEDGFRLHDSIRPLARELIHPETAAALHSKVALHYQNKMNVDGYLYTTIDKWGYHLERSSLAVSFFIASVKAMKPSLLFDLWGVYYCGFPFTFSEKEYLSVSAKIENLENLGLVSKNGENSTDSEYTDKKNYVLNTHQKTDICFLEYKSRRETAAGAMGYIDVEAPNYSYEYQVNTVCHWEHRIEFEPLPPHTASAAEMIKWFEEALDSGELLYLSSEERLKIAADLRVLSRVDSCSAEVLRELVGSCPLFGHCCPGGPAQANVCREQEVEADPAEV